MLERALACRIFGVPRYPGTAEQICQQIVKNCWNGEYFQTSTGHFNEFYTRDFAWCVESLIKLGYRQEVLVTLAYALKQFEKHNIVTTTINPKGQPFDFPVFAADSLPSLIYSLYKAKATQLLRTYKQFLEEKAEEYYDIIDFKTGLVKPKHFSSIKDHAIRKTSCYDCCMAGWLAAILKKLRWKSRLDKYNYPKIIKKYFWTGTYFLNDLSGEKAVCGDANIFPFWTGLFDKKLLGKTINHLQKLAKPAPLRYSTKKFKEGRIIYSIFAPNYEGTTIWAHLGMIYLHTIRKRYPKLAREGKKKYSELIEKYGNFIEVYNPNLKPYQSLFYYADTGMIWAANYLTL